ncbi:hypothetical protein [Methanobrevibacter sp.]|uniref:hypothetical protein n=1 Tax=Methanobrevibacter sp. TaxID=66852 RepID=UPI00386441B0
MENRDIIIIMVAVILVLAAVLGVMFFQSANAKKTSEIKITSNKTLYEGDNLSVKLTDSNKTAISNQSVKITIADKNGKVVANKSVKTNSKGKAKMDLDLKKGKYVVDVDYKGNKDYSPSHDSYNLNVEAVTATNSAGEIKSMEYTEHSPTFGNYRIIESQQELGVIETSNGEYFVLAGDGYYTYGGHDSNGNIKLGSYVGKYNM